MEQRLQQQQQQLPAVLPLLLAHSQMRRQRALLAALLATSRGVRAVVREHGAGVLLISVKVARPADAAALAAWLTVNGCFVGELRISDPRRKWHLPANASLDGVAAALQRAAATGSGLRLCALTLAHAYSAASAQSLLPALPACLTRLELKLHSDDDDELRRLADALACLSELQQVSVSLDEAAEEPGPADLLLPAVAGMRQLTQLHIAPVTGLISLRHLPVQLRQLSWLGPGAEDAPPPQPPLELGRLTALEQLTCSHVLRPGDVLPPGLVSADVLGCRTCGPLLALSALRVLDIAECEAPARELLQLNELPALTELRLGLLDSPGQAVIAAAAPAWPQLLQLRSLHLGHLDGGTGGVAELEAATVQALAAATALTRLELRDVRVLGTTSSEFGAAVLGSLQALQRLVLSDVEFDEPAAAAAHAAAQAAAQAAGDAAAAAAHATAEFQAAAEEFALLAAGAEQPALAAAAPGFQAQAAADAAMQAAGELEEVIAGVRDAAAAAAAAAAAVAAADAAADPAAVGPPGVQLAAAIARLPQLAALELAYRGRQLWCSRAAACKLAAASQLTSLELPCWPWSEARLASVVRRLPRLSALSIVGCKLSDAALASLPGIAPQLTRLNCGSVRPGHVTAWGLMQLTGLQRLQTLNVFLDECASVSWHAALKHVLLHCKRVQAAAAERAKAGAA